MGIPFEVVRPDWLDLEWLDVFTTLAVTDGIRYTFAGPGSDPARNKLRDSLMPIELTWIYSRHEAIVGHMPYPLSDPEMLAECDALVVTLPGQAVALPTADCLPVVIADVDNRGVALAHAGWRGLAAGVIEKTLGELLQGVSAEPIPSLRAWIGPSINAANYEVGTEVQEALLQLPASTKQFFQPTRGGKYLADIKAIARAELIRLGVLDEAISEYSISSYSSAELHSFRRDGESSGRMATVVALKPLNNPILSNIE